MITTTSKDTSEEEDDNEEDDDEENDDEAGDEDDGKGRESDKDASDYAGEQESDKEKEAPLLRFGPPKGRSHLGHVKSVANQNRLVEGNLFLFCYFYLFNVLSFFIDIQLSNLPRPEKPVPANGSSRSSGGILRGRALGNFPNIGDPFETMPQDVQPLPHGRINITIVQQPPSDVVIENPTSHLKVVSPCFETLGPLLQKVAKSYSPVRSKYLVI